jgi:hypothetical protein
MGGHCDPETATGSGDTFAKDFKAHRNADLRDCGAGTIVVGQGTVFVNDRLWSVDGDPNNHGAGNLIAGFTGVFVQDIPVIVVRPDHAVPDSLCLPDGGGGGGDGGDGGGEGGDGGGE